ncbi:MAG: SGNH/GDSL hydrolase family protein [Rhizomicrobium sp.]|nr:SGNH/GDSL hydrolase family protein [Rhizomicrobium sp.]
MRRGFAAGVLALVAVTAMAPAKPASHWVASWATALMISDGANYLPVEQLSHATLRQTVRLSTGGKAYRLVLSNLFGTEPLHLSAVHVAKALPFNAAAPGAIDPASDRVLTFSGKTDVTIPVGAAYTSDPVVAPVAAFADLSISILYDTAPVIETGHPGSRQTSYVLAGNHTADASLSGAVGADHWYQIAAIEVLSAPRTSAIAVVGDSITDGRGSTTNGNDRWTNIMATALNAGKPGKGRAVLNAGIGGNCVLVVCLGPTALTRFDREVLEPAGVDTFIVYEGVNDLGRLTINHPVAASEHDALVAHLIEAFQQMAIKAKAHGLKSYIATILPFGGSAYYHPDAANEADRSALNSWIRSQKIFDGVIDFDAVMRDPSHPERLNPAYDTDGLHANAAGYGIMGTTAAKALGTKNKAVHGAARGKKV